MASHTSTCNCQSSAHDKTSLSHHTSICSQCNGVTETECDCTECQHKCSLCGSTTQVGAGRQSFFGEHMSYSANAQPAAKVDNGTFESDSEVSESESYTETSGMPDSGACKLCGTHHHSTSRSEFL